MSEDKYRELEAAGKRIQLYMAEKASAPLVVYHAVHGEGDSLHEACRKAGCPDFSLAVVNDIRWDDEMSPWAIPPVSKDDRPCSGEADEYLRKLNDAIMPAIRDALPEAPDYSVLAGYSLAGLFALYAAYQKTDFQRIVSASGSLWFPKLVDYVKSHQVQGQIQTMYFSLGNKESRTRNQVLKSVEENTVTIERYLHDRGIHTIYESNPGNHFRDAALRTAKGIKWTLEQ